MQISIICNIDNDLTNKLKNKKGHSKSVPPSTHITSKNFKSKELEDEEITLDSKIKDTDSKIYSYFIVPGNEHSRTSKLLLKSLEFKGLLLSISSIKTSKDSTKKDSKF